MATTTTVVGIDQLKGPSPLSTLRVSRFAVRVSGTYDAAGRPSFNILTALQSQKQGRTAVAVKSVTLLEDAGATRMTAPNANIALSGTGNQTATFRLSTASTNGDAGAEVADTTAVEGVWVFAVVHTVS